MKPKRGRPQKSPTEAKSHYLMVRVNQEDRDRFYAAAEALGVPVSKWVRERLLIAAGTELNLGNKKYKKREAGSK